LFLNRDRVSNILEIGGYATPIYKYLKFCPKTITIVEPAGELSTAALSVSSVPTPATT